MPIHLSPDLERIVREKLESGRYGSEDEVLREALKLLDGRDRRLLAEIEELRDRIAVGQEQLERGEGVPAEVVFADLWQKTRERRVTTR